MNRKTDERRFYYGWIIVIASFFIQALAFGGSYSFGVFFQPLWKKFRWTLSATLWVFLPRGLDNPVWVR